MESFKFPLMDHISLIPFPCTQHTANSPSHSPVFTYLRISSSPYNALCTGKYSSKMNVAMQSSSYCDYYLYALLTPSSYLFPPQATTTTNTTTSTFNFRPTQQIFKMSSTAFVSATPILSTRPSQVLSHSTFSTRHTTVVAAQPARRASVVHMNMDEDKPQLQKIPQGFTLFSEQLNGRAAMMGFILALTTEAITGKGIIGQVSSIFDIVNLASALGN